MFLADVVVKCPRCGAVFTSRQLPIFVDPGTRTSELRQDFGHPIAHLEPFEICTCPTCANADWMTGFVPCQEKSELYQAKIPAHMQYRNAAIGAERDGRSNFQVGMFYLYAAWCADDVIAVLQAREYRSLAAAAFLKSLVDSSCPAKQRAEIEYLIGELLRRVGDFSKSQEHLRSVVSKLPGKFALMGRKIMRLAEQGRVDEIAFDI
jgi:uncharacterized protein (DUF2225 family)